MFSFARLITSNQAAIIALFRVVNRYVGNFAPMPRCFRTIRNGLFGGCRVRDPHDCGWACRLARAGRPDASNGTP